jgi:hypothetical protein
MKRDGVCNSAAIIESREHDGWNKNGKHLDAHPALPVVR